MLDEKLEIINDDLERIVAIAIKDRVATLLPTSRGFYQVISALL